MRLESQRLATEAIMDAVVKMVQQVKFDGETYEPARDKLRLSNQLDRVRNLMADGEWRALSVISDMVGGSDASVSARLRDLRKERFGGYKVEREHIKDGIWRYRVTKNG